MPLIVSSEEIYQQLSQEPGLAGRVLLQQGATLWHRDEVHIGLVNLMPVPQDPERDFGRLMAHSDIPVRLHVFSPEVWLNSDRNTPGATYRRQHHRPMSDISNFPVPLNGIFFSGHGNEKDDLDTLDSWPELELAFDCAREEINVTLASCWGAHASLFHHHDVERSYHPDKTSGVFTQTSTPAALASRLRLPERFPMPVSRHGRSDEQHILENPDLEVLSSSPETGSSIVYDRISRTFNFTGHCEYPGAPTLEAEFGRDLAKKIAAHRAWKNGGAPVPEDLAQLRYPRNIRERNKPSGSLLQHEWTHAMAIPVMQSILELAQSGELRKQRESFFVKGLPVETPHAAYA